MKEEDAEYLNWKIGKNGGLQHERTDPFLNIYEKMVADARYGWVIKKLKKTNARTIIEFGCGLGYGAYLMSKAGFKIKATDKSVEAIKIARKRYPYIDFEVMDTCNIDCSLFTEKYDAVVALEVVEHIENYKKAIDNWYKIVKRPGKIYLSTPNKDKTKGNNPHHIKEFSYEDIRDLFPKAHVEGMKVSLVKTKPIRLLFGKEIATKIHYKIERFLPFIPKYSGVFLIEVNID